MSPFSRKKVYGGEQAVHTGVVIACFEEFSKTLKKTVVVIDNASVHTSEEFEECLPRWKKKGLIIKYLSTYSPELNLIEILWRNTKLLLPKYLYRGTLVLLRPLYASSKRKTASCHHRALPEAVESPYPKCAR